MKVMRAAWLSFCCQHSSFYKVHQVEIRRGWRDTQFLRRIVDRKGLVVKLHIHFGHVESLHAGQVIRPHSGRDVHIDCVKTLIAARWGGTFADQAEVQCSSNVISGDPI